MVAFENILTGEPIYPKEPKPCPNIGETIEFYGRPTIYKVEHIHRKYDNFENGDLILVRLRPISSKKARKLLRRNSK